MNEIKMQKEILYEELKQLEHDVGKNRFTIQHLLKQQKTLHKRKELIKRTLKEKYKEEL